jgi:RNA recognition motif-containing protein
MENSNYGPPASTKTNVSLYVCDIPQNITKEELDSVFKCFGGFNEVRLARDKNRQRIAFVDYENEASALYAMNSLKGFRFHNTTKGITVRFSENTKNNAPQPALPGQPIKSQIDNRSSM